jgi:UDP-N-acetyl-D-mannosaminouronate:lipid I N-acetyl-D-mannosaminouronosyltransferase
MQYQIINNYKIHSFSSKEQFLQQIMNQKKILVAMNAEKIVKSDKAFRKIVNSNIGYTDGFGAVLALRRKGLKPIKIAGSEFWLDIIQRYGRSKKIYLIGSTESVIQKTVQRLQREYPHIMIVGYHNGYLNEEDKIDLIQELKNSEADIVFVAQGSPKQEFFMQELFEAHPALYMGLGGSFDIYAGDKKRAPLLFLKFELEWFYRLLQEPTRIGRQLALFKFLMLIFRLDNFPMEERRG